MGQRKQQLLSFEHKSPLHTHTTALVSSRRQVLGWTTATLAVECVILKGVMTSPHVVVLRRRHLPHGPPNSFMAFEATPLSDVARPGRG